MEEKKNGNQLVIIFLVILLLVAVGVICYLLGSNSAKENNLNNNEIKEEVKEPIVDNNQDIISGDSEKNEEDHVITPVSYTPKCIDTPNQQQNLFVDIDEAKFNNISEYIQTQKNVKIILNYCKSGGEFTSSTYNLLDNEKDIVLNEMKNSSVSIEKSGLGGICVPTLKINYERNNNQYYISYYGLFAMTSNDGNIYKILDKSVNNTLTEPQYCLYYFNNLSNTATSILNRLTSN